MNISLKFGDTNFIGIVNSQAYNSFVDEDWELVQLLDHFSNEMMRGNILVYQMTNEGIEHSWNIKIELGKDSIDKICFRKAEGYIKVTDNKLYVIDYDCLTMSAQFEDSKVPDDNCEKNLIKLENGIYKVFFYQYFNADKDEFIGRSDIDVEIVFTPVSNFNVSAHKVFWCTY